MDQFVFFFVCLGVFCFVYFVSSLHFDFLNPSMHLLSSASLFSHKLSQVFSLLSEGKHRRPPIPSVLVSCIHKGKTLVISVSFLREEYKMRGSTKENFRVLEFTDERYFEGLYTSSIIFKFLLEPDTPLLASTRITWKLRNSDSLAPPGSYQIKILSSKTQESAF